METPEEPRFMRLRGARVNNLKNINIDIPLKRFTIVTGLSGSGKSSLVFDTLYAEGQRRYVESLSTYTRQFLEKMAKPDIDSLDNISPAIALEQKNHVNNSRSTVATMSELYDYLRLLFAKIGRTSCVKCGTRVEADNPQSIARKLAAEPAGSRFYVLAPLSEKLLAKKFWPEKRKSLVQAGFERIVLDAETDGEAIAELAALDGLPPKLKAAYLVIDRMSLPGDPVKDSRLLEAIEQALAQAGGRIAVAFVGAKDEPWRYVQFSSKFRCDACGIDYRKPEPQMFSFNSPLGACAECSGFGFNLELDEDLVVPDRRKTLRNGAVDPFTKPAYRDWHDDLMKFCEKHKIGTGKRYEDLSSAQRDLIWNGDGGGGKLFPGIRGCFEELKDWKYKLHVRVFIRRYQNPKLCLSCKGSRLKAEALAVRVDSRSMADVLALSIENANAYFTKLAGEKALPKQDREIARDILKQIGGRVRFLNDVGVGYLTLSRLGKTLSGGECQRISLATQLGNRLCSTLYVLDEPSIGLHPADTEKLIRLLHQLRDHGNTVVVVEHDLDVIAAADYMIELGPHAGRKGGEVIVQGPLDKVLDAKGCLTAKYLTGAFSIPAPPTRRPRGAKALKIVGACENNLREVTVEFPLHQFIAVTGLSGSGKTTLVHRTLYNALSRLFHKENVPVGKFLRLYGADYLNDVVLLDQRPIGKSARSNPATYLKIWEDIRKILANQSLSIRRGYGPQHFSFNVDGGRCPVCKGEGEITLEMHFMADIRLPCEECGGKRFKKNVLEVEFKRKNVDQLLHATVDECIELFREYPSTSAKLQTLKKAGLGYLELGQSSTTMSGGESQRLKIASVLQEKSTSNMLYVFDEPTTGLHLDDTKRLLAVLHDLVDQKNTVVVIEHNLELVSQADWVIDMGPGGGEHGGRLVAAGTPEEIIENPESLTGRFLNSRHKPSAYSNRQIPLA
ncbi:MAG: excinuclease ABC subunit UvrA [Deltaproteobacteria bacterium]|nr:excinuclease ABC subunit UvrA [Deltaproteobacteria bacterium]